jgi:hypothetical protein
MIFWRDFMSKQNELLNEGFTCRDCPHYLPDPSGKTFGECKKNPGHPITEENHLTKGKNGCLFFDM